MKKECLIVLIPLVFISGCIQIKISSSPTCIQRFFPIYGSLEVKEHILATDGSASFWVKNNERVSIRLLGVRIKNKSIPINLIIGGGEEMPLELPPNSFPPGRSDECYNFSLVFSYNTSYGIYHEASGYITGMYTIKVERRLNRTGMH